jgi:hypothetical protein
MSDNLANPTRVDLAPSILAPRPPARVRVWLLIVSIIVAFGLGWVAATLVPNATPIALPSESPSATPEPEIDTDDDSAFVTVATRDLDDFDKDLDDMDTTLDENGFWRLLSNAVELNFNVSQLLGHTAPASIDSDWAAGLAQLEDDVDAIEAGITSSSESHVRSAVADARDTVVGLRTVVRRVD